MLSGGSFWRILGLNAVIWSALPGAVTKECLKRDVLGHRENNVYSCDHPVFTECCEHQGRFTCCEPVVDKSLKEQLQLWGMIAAMLVVGAMIYTCVVRDGSVFEAETLKEAVRKKLRIRNPTEDQKPLVNTSPLPELQPSPGYQWKATSF
ncbi:uncharacterized protein LOC112560567 [Pomacea canaliculata]|uniref:uncharacterized protein LOC112560567 n=1 Tax=Pomacea canaliculata TaxID=400727 RepID=UPI000D735424|nr:uncharacterized protein LOC112560567 [Pomacea canaliculata]